MKSARICCVLVAASLANAPGAAAQGFEPLPQVDARDVLGPESMQSVHHRVLNEVEVHGNTLGFEVESNLGLFQASSLALLEERIHELQTLGQAMSQAERDDRPFGSNLRGQLQVTGDSAREILTSPLSTAGQLAGQFGSNIGQTLVEINQGGGPEGAPVLDTRAEAPSAQRRAVATSLGLDPYSSNPKVQKFLELMAGRRSGGASARGITTVSVPRIDAVSIGGGLPDRRLRSDLKNLEPEELELRHDARLREMGVDPQLRRRFLEHDVLSPRHRSAIVEYLSFLGPIPGRALVVAAAAGAGSEAEALASEQLVRMLAVHHERTAALGALRGSGALPVGVDVQGTWVVALPADILYWNEEAARTFTRLAGSARSAGAANPVLLTSGIVTVRAKSALADLGFRVRERVLARR